MSTIILVTISIHGDHVKPKFLTECIDGDPCASSIEQQKDTTSNVSTKDGKTY